MAAAMWGGLGPVSRFAFEQGMGSLEASFWRALMAWCCFAVHAAIKGEVRVEVKDIPLLIIFGLTGVTLFYAANLMAVIKGGAAFASVMLYTAPAWVAVMSRLIFKEQITRVKIVAVLLTLVGVVFVCMGGGDLMAELDVGTTMAVLCGLTSGFCYSLYYIFGKYFSGKYSASTIFLYILPIGGAGLLPWVEFTEKTPVSWAALIYLAVVSTYLAYLCYYTGLKYLEPTRAVVTATFEPVLAAIFAFLIWGELFSPAGYLGAFFILAGVLIMIRDDAK